MGGGVLEQRRRALLDLVERRVPVRQAVDELARFPWDCDVELVVLRRVHLLQTLDELRLGRLLDSDVEEWAEALESRDDVAVEDDLLRQALFELSTPELFAPVHAAAAVWAERLSRQGPWGGRAPGP